MSKNHLLLDRRRWEQARQAALERAGFRSELSGRPGRLEVDHIVPLHIDPEQDPYDLAGLQVLLREEHIEKTRKENSRPLTDEEMAWEEFVEDLTRLS